MEELFNWIKDHKSLTTIIIISLFLIPLILVHCLFKSNFNIPWLESEWTAGDILNYIIGSISSIATIILSFVALYQTEKIKKTEQSNEVANTKRPFFIIDKVTVKKDNEEIDIKFIENKYEYGTSHLPTTIYIYFKNIGDGIANECSYELGMVPEERKPINCVLMQGTYKISYTLNTIKEDFVTKTFSLRYQNILGYRYKQIIIINAKIEPIPCDSYYVYIDNCRQQVVDYEDYYDIYINLISPQVPIGFVNNQITTKSHWTTKSSGCIYALRKQYLPNSSVLIFVLFWYKWSIFLE